MAISQLILACEVMYTSTPAVAVESCLVLVAQGGTAMQAASWGALEDNV